MENGNLQPKDTSPSFSRRRIVLFGKDSDSIIKSFFGSTATIAIFILALITIFLFKEGAGFIEQYHKSLKEYRLSGLEYIDILKENRESHTALTQYATDIRSEWINELKSQGLSQKEIAKRVLSPESKAFFMQYLRSGSSLKRFIKEKMDAAITIRDQHITNKNLKESLHNFAKKIASVEQFNYQLSESDRAQLILRLKEDILSNAADAEKIKANESLIQSVLNGAPINNEGRSIFLKLLKKQYIETENSISPVNFKERIESVTNEQKRYSEILDQLELDIRSILISAKSVEFNNPSIERRIQRFKELNDQLIDSFPEHKAKLAKWDQDKPIASWTALGSFLTGKDWITASDQQDWYGLLPLLSGSLLVSLIALIFAVPLAVGAAIYTNQIASPLERNFIKPYIEFVSAIPSVVIGFFGVVVLGEAIRQLSQHDIMAWVPFFPLEERLNVFTAGCLLALMAIPTIFTLAEDAINNVPKHLKEASLAIGATRLQTTIRVIVPSSLSAIISAIMLGFGRVIGETMVVLLCAGNRIKIPEFSNGIKVFFEPVHTMTGIIAQEMGEVVQGSVHYRALFMVGIVLFFTSMIINIGAQWVVKKYRKLGD
jgi:phosphate transport system permease protein